MTKKQIAATVAIAIASFEGGQLIDRDETTIVAKDQSALEVEVDGAKKYVLTADLPDGGLLQILQDSSPCVIPDSADGGEVDCKCDVGRGPEWRGANVCPVKNASGTQCIPSGCRVIYGLRSIK